VRRLLLLGLAAGLAVVAAGCADEQEGAGPGSSAEVGAEPEAGERRAWGDFDEGVLVVDPPGPMAGGDELLAWCVLVADSAAERANGLMDAPGPDLGGYDGMAFTWDEDATGGFWMKDTEVPLSIAYIDDRGAIVSTVDMDPCTVGDDCPGYPPAGPYRLAVEVPQGELADRGIVEGATVRLERRACPAA
jgi:uncharacterized membrane protein (UPF0127 family)